MLESWFFESLNEFDPLHDVWDLEADLGQCHYHGYNGTHAAQAVWEVLEFFLVCECLTHFRTMRRRRRGKTPPAPQNAIDADKFLRDELNRDTIYAKYYIGLVQREDDGYALLFASRGNHICCLTYWNDCESDSPLDMPATRYIFYPNARNLLDVWKYN